MHTRKIFIPVLIVVISAGLTFVSGATRIVGDSCDLKPNPDMPDLRGSPGTPCSGHHSIKGWPLSFNASRPYKEEYTTYGPVGLERYSEEVATYDRNKAVKTTANFLFYTLVTTSIYGAYVLTWGNHKKEPGDKKWHTT
jgi:hypothetical protein